MVLGRVPVHARTGGAGELASRGKGGSRVVSCPPTSLGIGIFNAGSSIGSAIAPAMVAWLTFRYGWRAAFVATGALGFIWLVAWLVLYDIPSRNRWLRPE